MEQKHFAASQHLAITASQIMQIHRSTPKSFPKLHFNKTCCTVAKTPFIFGRSWAYRAD
jgi:hypothetical protein